MDKTKIPAFLPGLRPDPAHSGGVSAEPPLAGDDGSEPTPEPMPFWRQRRLDQLTAAEWESLCDGCGKCCLVKLQDEETGAIAYTDLACRMLDAGTCRCRDYPNRQRHVPDCVRLTPANVGALAWMPASCAYRLVAAGEDLPWWHPLISGDPETVHLAGISARGRVLPETVVAEEDWEDHIVDWPDP